MNRSSGGIELTIPEFDLVSPIVFTADLSATGIVVWWQDHARKYGRVAARWALDLAAAEYEKVRATHVRLVEAGSEVRGADDWTLVATLGYHLPAGDGPLLWRSGVHIRRRGRLQSHAGVLSAGHVM